MSDGARLFGVRDLNQSLGNERTGDAGAEVILSFINRITLKHRENEIAGEFFLEILNDAFGCASLKRLFLETFELFFLTDIGAKRDHLGAILFPKPMQNDR